MTHRTLSVFALLLALGGNANAQPTPPANPYALVAQGTAPAPAPAAQTQPVLVIDAPGASSIKATVTGQILAQSASAVGPQSNPAQSPSATNASPANNADTCDGNCDNTDADGNCLGGWCLWGRILLGLAVTLILFFWYRAHRMNLATRWAEYGRRRALADRYQAINGNAPETLEAEGRAWQALGEYGREAWLRRHLVARNGELPSLQPHGDRAGDPPAPPAP